MGSRILWPPTFCATFRTPCKIEDYSRGQFIISTYQRILLLKGGIKTCGHQRSQTSDRSAYAIGSRDPVFRNAGWQSGYSGKVPRNMSLYRVPFEASIYSVSQLPYQYYSSRWRRVLACQYDVSILSISSPVSGSLAFAGRFSVCIPASP